MNKKALEHELNLLAANPEHVFFDPENLYYKSLKIKKPYKNLEQCKNRAKAKHIKELQQEKERAGKDMKPTIQHWIDKHDIYSNRFQPEAKRIFAKYYEGLVMNEILKDYLLNKIL